MSTDSTPECPRGATEVQLARFNPRQGFERGRPRWVEALWYLCKWAFFLTALPWPSAWRRFLLRCFGAKVGRGVYFRSRVNIHFPWRLSIGNHCWIGEECEIHNFADLVIEDNVAIAHRVFLTTGSHDYTDHTMSYKHRPTGIRKGCWICSCTYVGPGIEIGEHSVVLPGSVVSRSIEAWSVVGGNPAVRIKPREIRR